MENGEWERDGLALIWQAQILLIMMTMIIKIIIMKMDGQTRRSQTSEAKLEEARKASNSKATKRQNPGLTPKTGNLRTSGGFVGPQKGRQSGRVAWLILCCISSSRSSSSSLVWPAIELSPLF